MRRADQRGVVPGELGERLRAAPAASRCWRSGRRRPTGRGGTRSRGPSRRARRDGAASRRRSSRRRRRGLAAVPATKPSCSALRQNVARRPPAACSAAAPLPVAPGRSSQPVVAVARRGPSSAATTSCADRAAVERRDQRLDDRDRAVDGARVAPRSRGSAPRGRASGRARRSRRRYRPRWTRSAHLRRSASANFEIGRRGVDRVAAEDEQRLDLAGLHVGGQLRASDASWSVGAASTGRCTITVSPTLPSASLIACASACTAGGCSSPATTRRAPRCAGRSLASGATHEAASGVRRRAAGTPATPTAAATARANWPTEPDCSGSR